MIIAALNETPEDPRVAVTPSAVKQYAKLGFTVACEQHLGEMAGFKDADYVEAGAHILSTKKELLHNANIVLCINEPCSDTLEELPTKALIIGPIDNNPDSPLIHWCIERKISLFSMNLIPRISRAQGMDSLSSQANLAGYRAVLEGVHYFKRAIPMMMTAAGMIQHAKILILGAGVAGLQAIATAKRLGAVVYAFDVRRAAKEQVESLGAEFIEVSEKDNETSGGYAGEISKEYQRLQAELVARYAQIADIIITTALIPGKKAPILLTSEMISEMKAGAVIVDLATSRGGNCELSVKDQIITHNEVTIIGNSNLAGLVATTASELYSGNLINLMRLLAAVPSTVVFNPDDDIIKQALLCHNGQYLPYQKNKESPSL